MKRTFAGLVEFQSTPPVWGGDPQNAKDMFLANIRFQSTPPVWGGDAEPKADSPHGADFNPRPPCGGATQKAG